MANTLTEVMPKLLAEGLMALRQMAIMPRYVNRAYESLAGEKGSTIDVPIPSAIVAQVVAPGAVPPSTADVAPTKVALPLDKWYEAPFYLTDKDLLEAVAGVIPMEASEAIKALANQVDNDLLALYKEVYGFAGIAGTTPFGAGLDEFLKADEILNDQLAPNEPRAVVLNARATGAAKGLRAIQDASWRADPGAMKRQAIGSVLGYDWDMDQNIPRHTAGTGANYQINNGAGYAIGIKTVTVDTGSGTLLAGDIIKFAGHDNHYVVVSTVGGGTVTSITFEPGLVAAVVDDEAITKRASHRVNLAFHRDAMALASRPFAGADPMGLGTYLSAVDPISKLALRLEVTREHKRTRFSYDILYGVKMIRPALACRIAGE